MVICDLLKKLKPFEHKKTNQYFLYSEVNLCTYIISTTSSVYNPNALLEYIIKNCM